MSQVLKKGIYRHYKGGEYRVLNEVKDSETQEEMVVYVDLKDEKKIWVRPKKMFLESIEVKGEKKPRFELMYEEAPKIEGHPEAVVGPLIYNDKGEILLIKNPKFLDFWTIPGGHIELNETAEDAVRREIMEETNLKVKNIEFARFSEGINPKFFFKKKHFIFLSFIAELAGGEIKKSNEMIDYMWVAPEKTAELKINESIKPLIEYYLTKKNVSNDSFENKYLRALADYQNLLKQTAKDKEEFVKYALGNFLEDILPVYDHLKMSLNGLKDDDHKNPWVEGVKHVLKQFRELLKERGVEEIKTIGEKFDHETMDAIDGQGETVKQEVMAGYKLNGKVIRHAKVIVE
ncbi:MAG: nucleotide exchange factor GrpE [Patescibacteria group bacterium]